MIEVYEEKRFKETDRISRHIAFCDTYDDGTGVFGQF